MADGLCWCSSESRCPHGVAPKIPILWEDMEQIIDEVLQLYDRKTIKYFLKKGMEGNVKVTDVQKFAAYRGEGTYSPSRGNSRKEPRTPQSPDKFAKRSKVSYEFPEPIISFAQTEPLSRTAINSLTKRPGSASQKNFDKTKVFDASDSARLVSSAKELPSKALAIDSTFNRTILSGSLPKIPARISSPAVNNYQSMNDDTAAAVSGGAPIIAWGEEEDDHHQRRLRSAASTSPGHNNRSNSNNNTDGNRPKTTSSSTPGRNKLYSQQQQAMMTYSATASIPIELPTDTTLSGGLMRIADKLARLVLPWQAVLCPRAVETLFDLRQTMIQTKHVNFINQMKQKLDEKVMGFIQKKEEEVEMWLENETKGWLEFMSQDDNELTDYIRKDLTRMSDRAAAQDTAYRRRELAMATALDDHERDSTREQLINFRRVCRAQQLTTTTTTNADTDGINNNKVSTIGPNNNSSNRNNSVVAATSDTRQQTAMEVRMLQDTIAKAQNTLVHKKLSVSSREITRKIEESHDWLCSLADNAVTASESENMLKRLYAAIDKEKQRGMDSLYHALNTYKEQHSAILEAISVFAGRIHQHASDYLQREQLVSRAFLQYLQSVVSGEMKTHTAEQKKNSYAWESKAIADRGHRKEQTLISEFHTNIAPLDKLTVEFKDRMRLQLDHVTMKLQSVLNGRENDVSARKAKIHKKLARHVNKACNNRRQRLKDSTAIRRDEFQIEGKCIAAVEELSGSLRTAVDQIWVKEHLRERRIYEAATGRMERLEKSALIIWNKHSHLAIEQKEDYEDWMRMYYRDRDMRISERRMQVEKEWRNWRKQFGKDLVNFAVHIRAPVKSLVIDNFSFDVSVPVERNIEDLNHHVQNVIQSAIDQLTRLRGNVTTYLNAEVARTDSFIQARKQALLQDWQQNLFILNNVINMRVGGLKDMESDLEETIRLTILQHEVENSIFEQLSCSRIEQFWLEWRSKMSSLARELKEHQQDYEISKHSGKVKSRSNRKDRAIDDIMIVANERSTAGNENSGSNAPAAATLPPAVILPDIYNSNNSGSSSSNNNAMRSPPPPGSLLGPGSRSNSMNNNNNPISAAAATPATPNAATVAATEDDDTMNEQTERTPSDTMRLKRILDDIRPDIFRDFTHRLTRNLEKVRRDLGEGRKRIVPPYSVAKSIIASCDAFWERAKLSERCVGRISSRGVLLFSGGLPVHARAMFGVAAAMFVISKVTLKEDLMYIDCDDVFEITTDAKQVFLVALLTLTLSFGDFGIYFLHSECLWACSCFNIDPPVELLKQLDAKGLDKSKIEEMKGTGFYSEDPVDLANCLLNQTTELLEVQQAQERFQADQLDIKNGVVAVSVEYNKNRPNKTSKKSKRSSKTKIDNNNSTIDIEEENLSNNVDSIIHGYHHGADEIFHLLETFVPYREQLQKLTYIVPTSDIHILAAMLGRPDGSLEMTTHRVCQAISLWRRTALAIIHAVLDPPSTEYPRIKDLVAAHTAMLSGKRRMGYGNINCVSPFGAVSAAVDWVTSIRGVPISVNQALCVISRGGGCDPWLEDPKQSGRGNRIIYEINELLEALTTNIPKSMKHNEHLQASLPKTITEAMKKLDLNRTGMLSIEALRTYTEREDTDLTNTQISLIYWSLCRVDDGDDEDRKSSTDASKLAMTNSNKTVDNEDEVNTAEMPVLTSSSGSYKKPVVNTMFHADPDDYMERFAQDVDNYLESMPSIDANVIFGYLPKPLVPTAAQELVTDAMQLDPSSRNAMPSTCCVWLGQRAVQLDEALNAITVAQPKSKEGNLLLGVGTNSFHSKHFDNDLQRYLANVRIYVEVDLLTKYPELCEIQSSNRHYGPAGNDPILSQQGNAHEGHWQELTNRRIHRMDKLTISWRDTMMNEWSTSLYQSRQQRYAKRVAIVQQCVGVYHKQYATLRENIVTERQGLVSLFSGMQAELLSLIQEDYNFFAYHSSHLERALRRFEGQLERIITVLGDIMTEYQRHCGTLKRRGIARIIAASEKLRSDLSLSCNGLITGYTVGYAQGYFDELIYRGEIWRSTLTDVQGRLILEKELFMTAKDEIDRDITIQVTDRLTIDRNKYKGHLESLAEDTARMLDVVSTTRASYASVQKDANARLILRIEKAVRECRRLRVAAEQQAELEVPVMRDIRTVLDSARTSCVSIVAQIKETCLKQLWKIEPQRPAHLKKMENRVSTLKASWTEVENTINPWIEDYKREVYKHLSKTRSQCMELIGRYRDAETREIKNKHLIERKGLITSFRKHFREYDLCESAIFERFNEEVDKTVKELNVLWGPSKPRFIAQGVKELQIIVKDSLISGTDDVVSNMFALTDRDGINKINDDNTMGRMEVVDIMYHSLQKCTECALEIPKQYVQEKRNLLLQMEEVSMERNGDMVRPQVKAVLDLLLSGIEIEADFTKGYISLIDATATKATECSMDLKDFNERYTDPNNPVSIGYSASLTLGRLDERRQEVKSILEASEAHVVADTSRLDVLLNAGQKDIEEWASLTLQLVENAFHNAEQSYLSNLWPSPPATPRLDFVPEDEDRVGKLKALLKDTHAGNIAASLVAASGVGGSIIREVNATSGLGIGKNEDMALAILGGKLEDDDEVEEAVWLNKKEQRRREKLARKQEKERIRLAEEEAAARAHVPPKIKPEETRELQQGWFECCTSEGYTYYFNPRTEESLWQLPAELLKPRYGPEGPDGDGNNNESITIETPRELLMMESVHAAPRETVPLRIVSEDHKLVVVLDPIVLMSQVAEEARAAMLLAVETALDITAVIRGKKGKDERTIAALLGDRYNPNLLIHRGISTVGSGTSRSGEEDKLLPSKRGVVGDTVSDTATQKSGSSGLEFNNKGRLINEDSIDGGDNTDPVMAAMLRELGLGSITSSAAAESVEDPQGRMTTNTVGNEYATNGSQLGLGMITLNDGVTNYIDNKATDKSMQQRDQKFIEKSESDYMRKEEELSIQYENNVENSNCNAFAAIFKQIIKSSEATIDQKIELQRLALLIKPVNTLDIMTNCNISWKRLDGIISETLLREAARKELTLQLRTEEGMKRQQMILDHGDDIDDMAAFLHNPGGLGKTAAKRVATECILRDIATPKKLSKLWNRQQVSLAEFLIDSDDIEELEKALKTLALGSTVSNYNEKDFRSFSSQQLYYQQQQQLQELMDFNSRANSGTLTGTASSKQLLGSGVSFRGGAGGYNSSGHNTNNNSNYNSRCASPALMNSVAHNNDITNATFEASNNLILDPALVTEIDDPNSMSIDNNSIVDRLLLKEEDVVDNWNSDDILYYNNNMNMNNDHRSNGLTKDGYKSFTGGWIEGISEDGHVYYYNTATGVSSWQLPSLTEAENESNEQQQQNYVLGGHQLESNSSSYYHQDNGSSVLLEPTNNFAQYSTATANNSTYENQLHYDENGQPYYESAGTQPEYYYDVNGELQQHYNYHTAESWEEPSQQQLQQNWRKLWRRLPIPVKSDVITYSKKEGVTRQLSLLNAQDRWQNSLVKSQHYLTEQKSLYLRLRVEMFEKVSTRVDARLATFVEDIKYMQKTLKKELGDSMSTERDLRRLFEQKPLPSTQNDDPVIQTELLSFILESLEKFKVEASQRYESAYTQIDKFGAEWEIVKTELNQIGDLYDEGVAANLEQCRMACEHNAKLFAYDQLKAATTLKQAELHGFRAALHNALQEDTIEEQERRALLCAEHSEYNAARNQKRSELLQLGWGVSELDAELSRAGYPALDPETEAVPEEEYVMSFLLTQLEMEASLSADYDSIIMATKSMTLELQKGTSDFDSAEKKSVAEDGSWFNKHRETLERHEQALQTTLVKVRSRMNEGYQLLNSKLEALDVEVERAAEDELFRSISGDIGGIGDSNSSIGEGGS